MSEKKKTEEKERLFSDEQLQIVMQQLSTVSAPLSVHQQIIENLKFLATKVKN